MQQLLYHDLDALPQLMGRELNHIYSNFFENIFLNSQNFMIKASLNLIFFGILIRLNLLIFEAIKLSFRLALCPINNKSIFLKIILS